MTVYPSPTPAQLRTAFKDHGVRFTEHAECSPGRSRWSHGLRAATVHHTASRGPSSNYLATHWNLPGANACIQNGAYQGNANDGKAVILSWGDCWHTGEGGPWKGVAGKDSLHLVSFGIEVESLGTRPDISSAQQETVGRILASLVDLGMPLGHVHTHRDWTDGTAPVGGYPLPTVGRKMDTNKRWYPTSLWHDQAVKYLLPEEMWDGVVPLFDNVVKAEKQGLANIATYRLACRLFDLGHMTAVRPLNEQGYPVMGMKHWQASKGYTATGTYGPIAHTKLFD